MRVLFVFPLENKNKVPFQYGISLISSLLKQNGHKTDLIIVDTKTKEEEYIHSVSSTRPDLIAFTSTTNTHPVVEKCASLTLDIPTICGGIHATLSPDEVLKSVDMVCIGEGEYPMLELVNKLENGSSLTNIKNIWINDKDKIIRNEIRPLIDDLDNIPFADRELIKSPYEIMAGRGCPYSCSYCCNHALRKLYSGKGSYVRMRSVDNVLEEIRILRDRYRTDHLWFYDDTFTLNKKWLGEFALKYSDEFDMPISCNGRIENLDDETITNLNKSHCSRIGVGIESGNEYLRENILKRKMTNEQILDGFHKLRENDISATTFFMLGIPFETPETILESFDLAEKVEVDGIQCTIFYPYPNTEAHDVCLENGFLTDEHSFNYFDSSTLNSPTITRDQIKEYASLFRKLSDKKYNEYMKRRHGIVYIPYKLSEKLIGKERTIDFLKYLKNHFLYQV